MKRLVSLALITLVLAGSARPASLLSVSKTPFESFNCSVDFTPVVGTDGITLLGVVSTNLGTNDDSSAIIIANSPAPAVVGSTDVVVFRVQGGYNRQTHLIGVRVRDNVTLEIFEGQITLVIP